MSWSFSSGGGSVDLITDDQLEQLLGPRLLEWVTGRTAWRDTPDRDAVREVIDELKQIFRRSSRSFSAETLFNIELELSAMGTFGLPRLIELYIRVNPVDAAPGPLADPLAAAAYIAALSALPRALMPPEAMTLGFGGATVGFDLVASVARDPDVVKVFGELGNEESGMYALSVDAHWSTNSSTLNLGTAINALGEYALDLALLEGAPKLSRLGAASRQAAIDARALLRKEKISAPLVVNFSGIELDSPLKLKEAVIYPAASWARHLRAAHPSATAIGVMNTDFWLNEARGRSEFEQDTFFLDAQKFEQRNRRSQELIDERVLRLRLSLLFASENIDIIAPFPFAVELSSPLQSKPRMTLPVRSWGSGASTRVQVDKRTWRGHDYTSRSRSLPKHLHMAVRRLLSAAAEREDASEWLCGCGHRLGSHGWRRECSVVPCMCSSRVIGRRRKWWRKCRRLRRIAGTL